MSKNLMLILIAGVDIWAALLITQIRKKAQPWEVSMAISDQQATAGLTRAEPIQIWMTRNGDIGFWPERNRPRTLKEVNDRLRRRAVQAPEKRLEVRLLCDRELTIHEWGRIALQLSRHAEAIRIGPLLD